MNNDIGLKIPNMDEFQTEYKKGIFDDKQIDLTAEDNYLCQFYKFLLNDYFHSVIVFDEAETYLKENGLRGKNEERKDYYEKYSPLQFDFFSLRSPVRIDRIADDARQELLSAMEDYNDIAKRENAQKLAVSSISDVLMIDKTQENNYYLLFNSVHGEGAVPANSIVMVLSSAPTIDENGSDDYFEKEKKRFQVLNEQKDHVEKAFYETTGLKLNIIVKRR
ncbi:hypothetical protein NXH67_16360 [Butyrivibrio sp. DSM 10294]|uniref:hypothetical protein n=1 Tax=Butyrivibrio sp. DSM 10294 TaxID=2972457 RepID=UPI00234F846A|nr:hypothetical protein [Butyrivibrio sp. DSM 10294]MDC7295086.1 hypothetical protein [Butyrivibrio sp. DSM 10294]